MSAQRSEFNQKQRLQMIAMLRGLFENNPRPFFDRRGFSPEALDDFVKREEVLNQTFQFVTQLMNIWKAQYPNDIPLKPLPLSSNLNKTMPQPMTPPIQESATSVQEIIPPEPVKLSKPIPPRSPTAPAPTVRFTLPNAKVGVAYRARVEGHTAEGAAQVVELRLPDDLGLHFDAERVELHGIPTLAGEHVLRVLWTLDRRERYSSDCILIVNPDPKTLWQVKEPAADAPYPKNHAVYQLLTGFGFRLAAASRRGRSHEHAGTFRDDDFVIELIDKTDWALLLVADGAGSANFSREGSRLAVMTAREQLTRELSATTGAKLIEALKHWDHDSDAKQMIGSECHYLFHRVATQVVEAIEKEAQQRNSESRNYATTLLAAIVNRQGNDTFLATFWMGDGAIAAYGPRGKVRLMGTPDGGEFAGQTRFLDRAALNDHGFAKRIGIGRFADLTAIFLMTDGVSDPRFETDRGLSEATNWDALWDELQPILTSTTPEIALCDWLHFFTAGHHDDRTLAVLW